MGNRPVLNYTLKNKSYQDLWDTRSMISLINNVWLNQEFPETEIHSIDSFIGSQEGHFSLKAANNTDISIIGLFLYPKILLTRQSKTPMKPKAGYLEWIYPTSRGP